MSQLLNEYLSSILEAGTKKSKGSSTPKTAKKQKSTNGQPTIQQQAQLLGVVHKSRGRYGKPGKDTPITHIKDPITKKLVPISQDEKPAKKTRTPAQPQARPRPAPRRVAKKTSSTPTKTKPVSPETQASIDYISKRSTKGSGAEFLDALQSGNGKNIKSIIDKLGITISPEGKVKAKNIQGGSDAQKIFGDNKDIAGHINTVLASMNLPLLPMTATKKDKPEDPRQIPVSSAEIFKPSSIFSDRPEIDVSVGPNNVRIGNSEYVTLQTFEPGSEERKGLLIEDEQIDEIKNRYPDLSDEEVERKADDVNGILTTHNNRVRFLQAAVQNGEKFKDLGSGQEAVSLVQDKLTSTLKSIVPQEQQKKLFSALDNLCASTSVEEFDNNWKQMSQTLIELDLPGGSVPLICEHLTIIRNAVAGQNIMLPVSDTFKLGDIISYSPDGVTSSDARSIINGLRLIEVGIDIGSVKRDAGGASAVGSRTETTTFAGEGVDDTLKVLGRSPKKPNDPGAMGEIYGPTTDAEFDKVKEKFVGVIRGRMDDIRSYYKIPSTVSDDDIIDGLSNGNPPTYDKKTGEFTGFGAPSDKFSATNPKTGTKVSPLNVRQLQLYSLAGYAFDAIYNVNATGQAFSNTTFKVDKILVSDGIAVMGRSKFQFNKNISWRANGVLRDDGIASHIVPTPRKKMRVFGG